MLHTVIEWVTFCTLFWQYNKNEWKAEINSGCTQFSCYTSLLVLNSKNLLRKQDIGHSEFVANIYLSLLKNLCFGLDWHSLVLFCFSVCFCIGRVGTEWFLHWGVGTEWCPCFTRKVDTRFSPWIWVWIAASFSDANYWNGFCKLLYLKCAILPNRYLDYAQVACNGVIEGGRAKLTVKNNN